MTVEEAAMVLAKVSTLDARINAQTAETARARAQAWSEVLDESMTLEWALEHVLDHYRTKRDLVMPADLNGAWRALRERERAREHVRAVTGGTGVPMPESVRQRLAGILGR